MKKRSLMLFGIVINIWMDWQCLILFIKKIHLGLKYGRMENVKDMQLYQMI